MSFGSPKWIAAYAFVVAAFLLSVSRYYHPPYGLTALIEFPAAGHAGELPAVRDAPHFDSSSAGYDGQFYAQLAVDPLLKDPAIDRALDNPPYRARRVLFSWTAYALGFGRPAWILQAYALQNVLCWLLLGWLLCRYMRPVSPQMFVLWAGSLLSHGMLSSVRYAVPDGGSVLVIALAVIAAERGWPLLAALGVGVAGLARETNLLAAGVLARFVRRSPRSWILAGLALVVCVLPLAFWLDYLRSIYRSRVFEDSGHVTMPLSGVIWKLGVVLRDLQHSRQPMLAAATLASLVGLVVQAGCVLWALVRKTPRPPWALVGASYIGLAVVMHRVVWEGTPGAFTRVLLPLSVGANVVLAQTPRPSWWLIAGANLGVIPGVWLFLM